MELPENERRCPGCQQPLESGRALAQGPFTTCEERSRLGPRDSIGG
jgi:hypothetical protein